MRYHFLKIISKMHLEMVEFYGSSNLYLHLYRYRRRLHLYFHRYRLQYYRPRAVSTRAPRLKIYVPRRHCRACCDAGCRAAAAAVTRKNS